MTKPKVEIGKTYGRLTVIERAGSKKGRSQWLCICSCDGNQVIVDGYWLTSGRIKSCGCYNKEQIRKANKRYNEYDLTGEYGIGYAHNDGQTFYFDLFDYERIKDHCWSTDKDENRLVSIINGKTIRLHRFILGITDSKINVDHINRNPLDNRRCNLRPCSVKENSRNKGILKKNKTGYIGVTFEEKRNKYAARIGVNKKGKFLGYFKTLNEALIVRLKAEKEYFGEFAPQRHLFKQFGIE